MREGLRPVRARIVDPDKPAARERHGADRRYRGAPGRAGSEERAIARAGRDDRQPSCRSSTRRSRAPRSCGSPPRTRSRNMITEHLLDRPTALVDGDSDAPAPVARLIDELIAAGAEGLRCLAVLDCGQEKPLERGVPGGRVCNACLKRRRPAEICSRCGKREPRATRGRTEAGVPCVPSADLHPAGRALRVCGSTAAIGPANGSARECRERPHTTCASVRPPARDPDRTAPARVLTADWASREPCRECGELTVGATARVAADASSAIAGRSGPAAGAGGCARSSASRSTATRISVRSAGAGRRCV